MKRVVLAAIAIGSVVSAQAQVRCKMPNGRWIEQRLADVCPAGAREAQTFDGKPLPLRLPAERPQPDQGKSLRAPAAIPKEQASSGVESSSVEMPFDACVKLMLQTLGSVGGSNTRVPLSTPDLRMLRVCANDGSVLITCSRLDGLMVTTKSLQRCD